MDTNCRQQGLLQCFPPLSCFVTLIFLFDYNNLSFFAPKLIFINFYEQNIIYDLNKY